MPQPFLGFLRHVQRSIVENVNRSPRFRLRRVNLSDPQFGEAVHVAVILRCWSGFCIQFSAASNPLIRSPEAIPF